MKTRIEPGAPWRRLGALLCMAGLALGLSACGVTAPAMPDGPVKLVRLESRAAAEARAESAASAAAGGPAAVAGMPAPEPAAASFTISAGDELDLRVPDAAQLDQTLRVRPDGKISLALIGTVHVQGRTLEDVQAELRERLDRLAGPAGQRDYLLQANDELEIKFPYHATLNEGVRVRPDGKIQLQLIGTVQAEGQSPEELQQQLRTRYARYLKVPELSVMVRSFGTQNVRVAGGTASSGRAGLAGLQPTLIVRSSQPLQVFVGGEVGKPGVMAFRPGLSLMQALVEAGGQLATGDASQLVVVRRGADETVQLLRPGLNGQYLRAPDRDVLLQPFDVVLLPKADHAALADRLNLYVFNLFPFLRNSSFGFSYNLNPEYR